MKTRVIWCLVILAAVAGVLTAPTNASMASDWHWSPRWCKSQLSNRGVAIADGRYFYPVQSFCIGIGGTDHCQWWAGQRQYNLFAVFMRTSDGVVRRAMMKPTGRVTWRGSGLKIIDRYVTYSLWRQVYGEFTWDLAQSENQKGCA